MPYKGKDDAETSSDGAGVSESDVLPEEEDYSMPEVNDLEEEKLLPKDQDFDFLLTYAAYRTSEYEQDGETVRNKAISVGLRAVGMTGNKIIFQKLYLPMAGDTPEERDEKMRKVKGFARALGSEPDEKGIYPVAQWVGQTVKGRTYGFVYKHGPQAGAEERGVRFPRF